jgi:hypothetical protein
MNCIEKLNLDDCLLNFLLTNVFFSVSLKRSHKPGLDIVEYKNDNQLYLKRSVYGNGTERIKLFKIIFRKEHLNLMKHLKFFDSEQVSESLFFFIHLLIFFNLIVISNNGIL